MIKQIDVVMVTVSDQDAAIDFWTSKLGFELKGDTAYEGGGQQMRWVEVGPAGGQAKLALNLPMEGGPGPGGEGNASFLSDDLDADHAALADKGVDVDEIMRMGPPVPPMFFFRDNDGNRFLLVQRD